MIGWKRIVVTAGEKIGFFPAPTHVLSSGVAGPMIANRSGLQWRTVRNLAVAWVLTLPVVMTLSGFLLWVFRSTF